MTMPFASQLIPTIEPLTIVDQNQIGGVKPVVTINLDEEFRGNIQSRLDQTRRLVKEVQATDVSPVPDLLSQKNEQVGDIHHSSPRSLNRSISFSMSVMPEIASSQSK